MTIKLLSIGIALIISCITTAHSFEISALPASKEECIKSEPDIIAVNCIVLK